MKKLLLLLLLIPFLSFSQIVTEDCNSIPDPGICLAYIQTFYFDQTTSQCEESYWGGCGGVVPFWTLEDCQNSCENTESEGCTDEVACNYDELATEDDGSCTYPTLPYGWGGEYGYDCDGNCLLPEDMCSCEEINYDEIWLIEGCWWPMEPPDNWIYPIDVIFEFDPINCAITSWPHCGCLDENDDGSCDDTNLLGCTDWVACNFNSNAIQDDGSCIYAEEYYDCDGSCLNDVDNDNLCDELECAVVDCADEYECILGECVCINDTDDDGECDELEIYGCTDNLACNYDDTATEDDGSCEYPGDECIMFGSIGPDFEYGIFDPACICSNETFIIENVNRNQLIKTIDILGRDTNQKGFQLHIYDDGSVEKKYVIK